MKSLRTIGGIMYNILRAGAKVFLLVPVLLGMVWVNYTVDCAGYYHNIEFENEIALQLLAGDNLPGYDQMDERRILQLIAENLEQPFNTLALGSSRIMQMNGSISGAVKQDGKASFFNCGMSGADIRDVLGAFYLFDKAGMLPQNLIIGLDPWLLNGNPDAYSPRSNENLYNEFLTEKLGIQRPYTTGKENKNWSALFSPSYFQGNLAYLMKGDIPASGDSIKAVTGDVYSQTENIKMADGSVVYAVDFRDASLEVVDERARVEAGTFLRMDGYLAPDSAHCDVFDRFIQYAKKQGVNVVFLLVPYHPTVYSYASEFSDNYPGFFLTEPWYVEYAKENNIPLYGSYNPFVVGILEENYYDGLHIKSEAISDFFPGTQKVLEEQKKGIASSPWLSQEAKVSYQTAETLIARRYQIAAPECLTRGEDTVIMDKQCYRIQRYSSSEQDAILLASYAVCQNTGSIYRHDTDLNDWVIYKVFE